MRRLLPFLVLALAAIAPQTASAALKLDACDKTVDCGQFRVPLDHAGKVAGSIDLAVTRYNAK